MIICSADLPKASFLPGNLPLKEFCTTVSIIKSALYIIGGGYFEAVFFSNLSAFSFDLLKELLPSFPLSR